MASSLWKSWLDGSVASLRTLLSGDLSHNHGGATKDQLHKARALLKATVAIIERGDAEAWRRLAVAADVLEVSGALGDTEPAREGPVDSTMPALFEAGPPPSQSVDETVALDDVQSIHIPDDDSQVPAGPTLVAGEAPAGVSGHGSSFAQSTARSPRQSNHTVPIPVHMPSGVTASGTPSTDPSVGMAHPASSGAVLDVEKYAVLCAWTEARPDRRQHLHNQYGLQSEEERRQLDARFEELFKNNLQLRSTFERRLKMHLGFLRRSHT